MLPSTVDRVADNTPDEINRRIARETEASIARWAIRGPQGIERRLQELDQEWDTERYLETMAPSFTLFGLFMGLTVSKNWFVLPIVVQSFFLQHALQGWCPPLPVLRHFGVRTTREIEYERYALKTLRGDFHEVAEPAGPYVRRTAEVLEAVRR